MRNILVCLCCASGLAMAEPDPLNTDSLLPVKPFDSCVDNTAAVLALTDVVNLALCANPQTREVWAASRAQAAQVGVAKADWLPNASVLASAERGLSGSTSGAERHSIGFKLNYLLYDFGLRAANNESARQLLAAAAAMQNSTIQTVLLNAVKAFYQTQTTIAAWQASKESERVAQESFAAAQARYEAGSAIPADKLQAQTALSQATLNRISAEGAMRNAQGTLANLLGWDAYRKIELAMPVNAAPDAEALKVFQSDVSALVEQARSQRADLQAAAAQVKAAQAGVDVARAAGKPTLSLNLGINQTGGTGGNSNNSSVGVNVSVPLFSGYAPTYKVRAAQAQADVKTAQLERVRLQVALDVWTAYQNLITANQAVLSSTDLLNSAQQAERVTLGRYQSGVGNILDVLNAQNTLSSARQQAIQAVFNWNVGRVVLAQAMGSLDEKMLNTLPDGRK